LAQNDEDQARENYAKVVELSPGHIQALNNLAWLSRETNLKEALKHIEKAYGLAPNDPLVLDTYGMLLIENNQNTEGYRMLQKAAAASPKNPIIQLHLGQALIKQQKFAEAQSVLNDLIEANPEAPSANEARELLASIPKQ